MPAKYGQLLAAAPLRLRTGKHCHATPCCVLRCRQQFLHVHQPPACNELDFVLAPAPYNLYPAGLLLFGPPGCGKTHIVAAAVAATGARLISVKVCCWCSSVIAAAAVHLVGCCVCTPTSAVCLPGIRLDSQWHLTCHRCNISSLLSLSRALSCSTSILAKARPPCVICSHVQHLLHLVSCSLMNLTPLPHHEATIQLVLLTGVIFDMCCAVARPILSWG